MVESRSLNGPLVNSLLIRWETSSRLVATRLALARGRWTRAWSRSGSTSSGGATTSGTSSDGSGTNSRTRKKTTRTCCLVSSRKGLARVETTASCDRIKKLTLFNDEIWPKKKIKRLGPSTGAPFIVLRMMRWMKIMHKKNIRKCYRFLRINYRKHRRTS